MRDLHTHIATRRAISPVSVGDNAAQVGETIDLQGFGSCELVIATGALADADATFAVLVEHGEEADMSDAAAVADHDLLGTEADAGFDQDDDDTTRKIGYVGGKRYVRLTITPTGNGAAALLSAVALLGHAHTEPAV